MSIRSGGTLAALAFGMIILALAAANARQGPESSVKQALRARCDAAIAANDPCDKAEHPAKKRSEWSRAPVTTSSS